MKNKIIKNIPNLLTFSRIISSVAAACVFVTGNIPLAFELYVYGAVSDFLDGFAARRLDAFSEFGRKLDALSDKIYAASLLIPSIICGNLLMILPMILELKISHINLKSQRLGFKTETQRIGKFKTAILFPTMITGLLATLSLEMQLLFWILLPISTILQVNSITVYENLLIHNLKNKEMIEKDNHLDIDKSIEIAKDKKNTADVKKVYTSSYKFNSTNVIDELIFYVTTPYFSQNEFDDNTHKKNNPKKRRLKK